MKSCPHCRRTFPDEYSFCLTDGTPLQGIGELTEEPTVVRENPVVKARKSGSVLIYILAGLLSFSLGITIAVLYFFWPRQRVADAPVNTISATASPSPTATKPSPSPERVSRTPAPSNSNDHLQDGDAASEITAPDPGPTKITFRPGRIQETVSGRVNDRRSFVLYARESQQLAARISSPNDCVNFDTGDSSVRYTTNTGNNVLTILNSCDRPATFQLSVSIR